MAEGGGFWTSLPGILTCVAAVLTAAGGIVLAMRSGEPAAVAADAQPVVAGGAGPAAAAPGTGQHERPAGDGAGAQPDGFVAVGRAESAAPVDRGVVMASGERAIAPVDAMARHPKARVEMPDNASVADPEGWANLRAAPSADGQVLGRIDSGTRLFALRVHGEWTHVVLGDGREGFIHSSRLVRDR